MSVKSIGNISIPVFVLFMLLFGACRTEVNQEQKIPISEDQLIEINKELVIKEQERIKRYIDRKNLQMENSELGFWYSIIEEGEGERIVDGSSLMLDYTCSLLDGTLCYSSDKDGYLNVVIGKSEIASGLDEALRLLKMDSEAIIILPSNLAYGLVGDGNRIPARAALIFRIKVIPD